MPPIIYIIFNRPDHTQQSFDVIKRVKPDRLIIASDGPRPDRPGEQVAVQQARDITATITWPCEVTRLYAEQNLGCGQRISTAITQTLQMYEDAIILEDDCIAEPTFFGFCEDLLDYYRDDKRIVAISGNNFQQGMVRGNGSYYFSRYAHCWGWATWRRAWKHFDLSMAKWPAYRDAGGLASHCFTDAQKAFWTANFDSVHSGRVDSWAIPWLLNCWQQNGISVLPQHNLVSNIGFDTTATHTTGDSPMANLPTRPMGKIKHPSFVQADVEADRYSDQLCNFVLPKRSMAKRIERRVANLIRRRAA